MSTFYQHLTPEAKMKKKKRNKAIMYATLILLAIMLSAFVTLLANQI
jgi:LPS O-antigen subunit length determinant protein (WzzB/FepE family)